LYSSDGKVAPAPRICVLPAGIGSFVLLEASAALGALVLEHPAVQMLSKQTIVRLSTARRGFSADIMAITICD